MTLPARDLDEAAEEARRLLPDREDRIEGGRIRGVHWFAALMAEAAAIVRRRRARSARGRPPY